MEEDGFRIYSRLVGYTLEVLDERTIPLLTLPRIWLTSFILPDGSAEHIRRNLAGGTAPRC